MKQGSFEYEAPAARKASRDEKGAPAGQLLLKSGDRSQYQGTVTSGNGADATKNKRDLSEFSIIRKSTMPPSFSNYHNITQLSPQQTYGKGGQSNID